MKNTNKLVALILTVLMLAGSTVAYAGTYVSDPVSPNISKPATQEQPVAEATPAPEAGEVTPPAEEVVEEQPAEEAPQTEAVVKTESENGSVNIRAAASTDAEIIGQLSSNDRVVVLGVEGDWTKIRANDVVGYVFSSYLQASEPELTPAPEETPVPEEVPAEEAPERSATIQVGASGAVHYGDSITLTAVLSGYEGVNYTIAWQVRDAGGSWNDISGASGLNYSFELSPENLDDEWRVLVTAEDTVAA